MLVSVVVIFYNQKRYVHRALRSVVQQTYSNLEIIVVDDGSNEDVESAARRFDDLRRRRFFQWVEGFEVLFPRSGKR